MKLTVHDLLKPAREAAKKAEDKYYAEMWQRGHVDLPRVTRDADACEAFKKEGPE